ncbi:MAG TPA: protein translocase subunit SecD [Symbiobacteriaceae bacterium]|jgi:preprotein translocase subunit SecD
MKAASILLAILLAIAAVGTYFTVKDPIQNHLKLGLDLKGGVHMVLQGVDSEIGPATPEAIAQATKVIENRINKLGLSEPLVQIDSKNRIVVELAGEQDTEKAKATIGTTAVLKFTGPDGVTVLDGKDIDKAGVSNNSQKGGYVVTLKLKGDGPKKFADATTKFVGQQIAITLDDAMISNPVVNTAITNGEAIIEGGFTAQSAKQLADLINGGALPVKLNLVENRVVTTTLGADSIAKSAKAGIIGMVAILVFMLLVYRIPGILANMALIVYTMLTVGLLIALNATFTLPGMAGLLLSIGMAVDGNIIIFERIKEELRNGKGLRSGIDAGFHRAFAAIFDGQITTAIAGAVLWFFGTGPIQGFAITLVVGVLLSIFTSVTLSRWLITLTVSTGWFDKRLFGIKEVAQ